MDKIKQWMYYFIIGIVSLVALIFLPMLGSTIGLSWNIPDTAVGWIVWIVTKIIVAVINVLIFHSFMQQAKLNVADNPKYIEAREILMQYSSKIILPRSPQQWNRKQYGVKGVSIFITTALATIALTQAILSFDWVSMLSYLFTIIMGLIFGVLQMKVAEDYWTDEFYRYAIMIKNERETQKRLEMDAEERNKQRDDTMGSNCGTDILVSCSSNVHPSSNN